MGRGGRFGKYGEHKRFERLRRGKIKDFISGRKPSLKASRPYYQGRIPEKPTQGLKLTLRKVNSCDLQIADSGECRLRSHEWQSLLDYR